MKKLLALALALTLVGCSDKVTPSHIEVTCKENLKEYSSLMEKKMFDEAGKKLAYCATLKPELYKDKVDAADIQRWIGYITDETNPASVRLMKLDSLTKLSPEEGAKYKHLRPELLKHSKIEAENDKRKKIEEDRRIAKQKKSKGVSIGMTQEDVLASSWGKPTHINRTTNQYGVREQWVYRQYQNGYLYFTDGILTSIQN
jgi:hypothetical protein